MFRLPRFALLLLAPFFSAATFADDSSPDYVFIPDHSASAPAARPMPKYTFTFGDPARWPGVFRWRYNPAGAPPAYADPNAAVADLSRTFDAWSASCNVRQVYDGETAQAPNARTRHAAGEQPDYANVVGWAALEGNTAGVTYAWYRPGSGVRELVDADVILSPTLAASRAQLERTAKHEWGHALGLGHSDRAGALMSGPPGSAYNGMAALAADDVRGCRCLYGPAPGQPAGYSCSLPRAVDLGLVPVGAPSVPRAVTLVNDGNGPLSITGVRFAGGEVAADMGCAPGHQLAAGARCTVYLVANATGAGARDDELTLDTSDGPYAVRLRYEGTAFADAPVAEVVEYHHAGFGHWFVTSIDEEIRRLDAGGFEGWTRSGRTLRAWTSPRPGSVPVCRFFSASFAPKSSHFYTASVQECAQLKGGADWQFEGEVFHAALPDAGGACPGGTQPVYRLYNDGRSGAPNHRYTLDSGLRSAMTAQGWVPEGAGPGVAMCAPL